ncbi:hypothetical protein [Devosia naphthalenivorans]|uniref:hypothetical protein n=1 Tax=Devosia naphthalenivorans TaxID=2082392 RepID=UPI000D3C951C|nr:hypothetical protein [Devosia naphthalenivorans]
MRDLLAHNGSSFCPALQPNLFALFDDANPSWRLERKLPLARANILSGTGLFTALSFLVTAPYLAKGTPRIIRERSANVDRELIDSGGYQISTGNLRFSAGVRRKLYRSSSQFKYAIILDAPTSAIGQPNTGLFSFAQCMRFTKENAQYVVDNSTSEATEFLNVIQGRNRYEALVWFRTMASFNDQRIYGQRALRGVAFAGATRLHFSIVLELLLLFLQQRLLNGTDRFHFLGTSHPEIACILTVIQDCLRDILGPGVMVTFDSATPFLLAGRYRRAYDRPILTEKELRVPVFAMPEDDRLLRSDHPWPVSSPVADRFTLGDLNTKPGNNPWDRASDTILALHNIWIMSHAVAVAINRLRLPYGWGRCCLPNSIVTMAEIIREAFRTASVSFVRKHAPELDQLARRGRNTTLSDVFYDDRR